jgi:hypothetical protein
VSQDSSLPDDFSLRRVHARFNYSEKVSVSFYVKRHG